MNQPFPARFPGICSDCEEPIREGEEIRSSVAGGYEHNACPPAAERPREICQTCWLQKPCQCDDDEPPRRAS